MQPIALLSNKLVITVISGIAIAYGAACMALWLRQTRMIFFPSSVITMTPADLGMSYEEVWIPIQTDTQVERLHGWWMAAQPERGVVLYLHGNAINIGANVGQAQRFQQLGFSVLLIDYRGYGLSEGAFPSEEQVYEDAQAAWKYLTQERQIAPERILLYGHSLGGAIAIDLAVQQPEAAGLIVQSSFTSIREMVNFSPVLRLFPVDLLLHQRFDSLQKVPALQLPVLFIHGMADRQVPFEMSKRLYAATPNPKQLYLVPYAGHNDVADVGGQAYQQAIQSFVAPLEAISRESVP